MKNSVCSACNLSLEVGARYCRKCGAWQGQSPRGFLDWARDPRLVAFFAILAGVELFVILSLAREISPTGRNDRAPGTLASSWSSGSAEEAVQALGGEVLAIAEHYNCPCGNCDGDSVAACDCTHPGGAMETKGWIASMLNHGESQEAIDAALVNRFGPEVRRPAAHEHPPAE